MADRLGIYILRPPEHSQQLLANAQMRWLARDGAARGWRPISRALEAQEAANGRRFVVASYANPDPQRPGHIAVLRATLKSIADRAGYSPSRFSRGFTRLW